MNSVRFLCRCGRCLSVPASLRGRRVRCPACGEIVFAEDVARAGGRLVDPPRRLRRRRVPPPEPPLLFPLLGWSLCWTALLLGWWFLREELVLAGENGLASLWTFAGLIASPLPLAVFLANADGRVLRLPWDAAVATVQTVRGLVGALADLLSGVSGWWWLYLALQACRVAASFLKQDSPQ